MALASVFHLLYVAPGDSRDTKLAFQDAAWIRPGRRATMPLEILISAPPPALFAVTLPMVPWYACDPSTCKAEDNCRCASMEAPLPADQMPQFVLYTVRAQRLLPSTQSHAAPIAHGALKRSAQGPYLEGSPALHLHSSSPLPSSEPPPPPHHHTHTYTHTISLKHISASNTAPCAHTRTPPFTRAHSHNFPLTPP